MAGDTRPGSDAPPTATWPGAELAPECECPRCGRTVRRGHHPDGRTILVEPEPTRFGRLLVQASGLVIGTTSSSSLPASDGLLGFSEHATVCRPPRTRPASAASWAKR